MTVENECGVFSILKAMRSLAEAVPEEGQKVDWQALKLKKEIGLKAIAAMEECFTHEPLRSEAVTCQNSWPRIWG